MAPLLPCNLPIWRPHGAIPEVATILGEAAILRSRELWSLPGQYHVRPPYTKSVWQISCFSPLNAIFERGKWSEAWRGKEAQTCGIQHCRRQSTSGWGMPGADHMWTGKVLQCGPGSAHSSQGLLHPLRHPVICLTTYKSLNKRRDFDH